MLLSLSPKTPRTGSKRVDLPMHLKPQEVLAPSSNQLLTCKLLLQKLGGTLDSSHSQAARLARTPGCMLSNPSTRHVAHVLGEQGFPISGPFFFLCSLSASLLSEEKRFFFKTVFYRNFVKCSNNQKELEFLNPEGTY